MYDRALLRTALLLAVKQLWAVGVITFSPPDLFLLLHSSICSKVVCHSDSKEQMKKSLYCAVHDPALIRTRVDIPLNDVQRVWCIFTTGSYSYFFQTSTHAGLQLNALIFKKSQPCQTMTSLGSNKGLPHQRNAWYKVGVITFSPPGLLFIPFLSNLNTPVPAWSCFFFKKGSEGNLMTRPWFEQGTPTCNQMRP
jgi:hypothetical protein